MQQKIKIAQVIGRTINGGVENYIFNYYSCIDRNRFQFDFLVENESKIINPKIIAEMGGRIIFIPSVKNIVGYKKALKRIFKENKYDIVQANINSLSYFPLKVAMKSGVKIRICNSLSTTSPKEKIRNLIKNYLKRKSKKYANYFFANSDLSATWLFGNDILLNTHYYKIKNPIHIERYVFNEAVRNELVVKHNLQGKIVFGTIGRLENQKNQMFLLDVFRELVTIDVNSFLIIIGDGCLQQQLINKAKSYGLEKNVLILTSKDVGVGGLASHYYSLFDCFILPSLYEGLPTVGIEAQINGLPCFFSDSITSETKISNKTFFLSLKLSAAAWAKCIYDNFRFDRTKTEIFEDYDVLKTVKKLEMAYESMIKENQK